MSTPRKGKKGGGRRSPSPRASPQSTSSSEGAFGKSHEALSRPQQLQISELVDAGISSDETRVLISPSALNALALKSGDLVRLEWSSTDKNISSCSNGIAISPLRHSDSDTAAPLMSIVLTAFLSTNSAPYRVAVHPSILSFISAPCRFRPNTLNAQTVFCCAIDAPSHSRHPVFSHILSLRPLSLLVKGHPESEQSLVPLTDAAFVACSICASSSPPLSGLWPSASQWPSLISCRLQVDLAVLGSFHLLICMLHTSHSSTLAV
jgi:hypothetical protein